MTGGKHALCEGIGVTYLRVRKIASLLLSPFFLPLEIFEWLTARSRGATHISRPTAVADAAPCVSPGFARHRGSPWLWHRGEAAAHTHLPPPRVNDPWARATGEVDTWGELVQGGHYSSQAGSEAAPSAVLGGGSAALTPCSLLRSLS